MGEGMVESQNLQGPLPWRFYNPVRGSYLQLCRDLKNLALEFDAPTKLDFIPEIPPTPPLRHGLKDWDISGSQVTPNTLGPVIAVLSWVFLDMWDVKCRSQVEGEAARASEGLLHSLERIADAPGRDLED